MAQARSLALSRHCVEAPLAVRHQSYASDWLQCRSSRFSTLNDSPRQQALALLASQYVLTLATQDEAGVWAAAVYYVNQGFDCYFLSQPGSRHARAVEDSPQAAITVNPCHVPWQQIQGVQAEGDVLRLSGSEAEFAQRLYSQRHPFVTQGTLAALLERVTWYRFIPQKLYFIDNARGLGKRVSIDLSEITACKQPSSD